MRREQLHEIRPMSQRRRWAVRAGAGTIAAVGLGLGLAGGYKTVVDQDLDMAPPLLLSAFVAEVGAGLVILEQLRAEEKNKEYLKLQSGLNTRRGLLAALHYRLAERKEALTRMGLIKPEEERSKPIDIPDVFRNAFDNENPDNNDPEAM